MKGGFSSMFFHCPETTESVIRNKSTTFKVSVST